MSVLNLIAALPRVVIVNYVFFVIIARFMTSLIYSFVEHCATLFFIVSVAPGWLS